MPSTRRTEFTPFVLDLIDCMEEKIHEAIADEDSRAGAVSEAAGAIPFLRDRLRESEAKQAQFLIVFDQQMYNADAAKWWTKLACMERPEFEKEAADLVGLLTVLRRIAAAT